MNLPEFYAARLDEREALAREALGEGTICWEWDRRAGSDRLLAHRKDDDGESLEPIAFFGGTGYAEYIARYGDPARALLEVAGGRRALSRLLAKAASLNAKWDDTWFSEIIGPLAAVDSGHPDWDPKWNPA
jgi:Family of unknown function (DUF6221)